MLVLCEGVPWRLTMLLVDMLGFKLDMPNREKSLTDKTRPIYLDMQVWLAFFLLG